jgi:hypothetical protein
MCRDVRGEHHVHQGRQRVDRDAGVLLFAPNNRQTPQVGVVTLESLGHEQGWFNDDGTGFDGYWQNLDDGDLDRAGRKLVLVRGVNIALGSQAVVVCSAFDADAGGAVTINEIVRAVHAALNGCAG